MPQTNQRRSNATEHAVLQHVARYRLTVAEAVRQLPAFHKRSANDATRALLRLESFGELASTWLYGDRPCFFLTAHGAQRLGIDPSRYAAETLSEETKIRQFAMLSLCCLSNTSRIRLTAAEIRTRLSGSDRVGVSSSYYVEADAANSRIGFLRVDMSGRGRWDRILASCLEDARDHSYDSAWRRLLDAGNFEITVATALPQKAERLCRALNQLPTPLPVPICVTAIPELLYLIAPPPS